MVCSGLVGEAVLAQTGLRSGELGHSGYLIIGSARDSLAGYQWQAGPGVGQISLTWREGMLTVPDSMALEPFAESDLAVPVTAHLTGAGATGTLDWREGNYPVSEPVMITDGVVSMLVSGGDLEILGTRIRYRPPVFLEEKDRPDPRASFMMLGGILLLILVLMRRARKRLREGS
jgi:hypothetical protein